MTFQAQVLTLFPEMFPGPLGASLAGKALEKGIWRLKATDIRDFAEDKHNTVDDSPAGGGPGMIMKPDVLARAVDSVTKKGKDRPIVYLSPRGRLFDQQTARDWAAGDGITLICGRFEGVDQRVLETRGIQEISVGDYVLSGGEPAAFVVLDALVRLLPGVVGDAECLRDESFSAGLLEYPQYTRPHVWEGQEIPGVLTSGHHEKIRAWRRQKAEELTKKRRPDLWKKLKRAKDR